MSHRAPSQSATTPPGVPRLYLPKEAAARLSISPAMLRKLTELGAIGHVRLGAGEQRNRVAYTEGQIADFINARTVPPSGPGAVPAGRRRQARRRPPGATHDPGAAATDVAGHLLKAALAAGTVTEWRQA